LDADEDGICDEQEILGCTEAQALNFHPAATDDDGSCVFPEAPCPLDVDGDGYVGIGDILDILSGFGESCE